MPQVIIDFLSLENICNLFLSFIIYSFIGWFFETLLHVVRDRKAVKRGFLFGPICPIYGFGAIIIISLLYGRVDKIYEMFLGGFLVCGVLEFTTHLVLEKIFHAMWWDYSSRRFNIQGRIYLNGLVFMGLGSIILLKFVHPFMVNVREAIPSQVIHLICLIVYTIFLMDIATTIADLKNSVGALRRLMNSILKDSQDILDVTDEKFNEWADSIKNNEIVMEMINKLKSENSPIKKFVTRYPEFNIKQYKFLLDIIRDKPDEEKARKDIKLHGENNDFDEQNSKK